MAVVKWQQAGLAVAIRCRCNDDIGARLVAAERTRCWSDLAIWVFMIVALLFDVITLDGFVCVVVVFVVVLVLLLEFMREREKGHHHQK